MAHLELLIHTTDTVKYRQDYSLWTPAMIALDKASNVKQGYIQQVRPAGFKWGVSDWSLPFDFNADTPGSPSGFGFSAE